MNSLKKFLPLLVLALLILAACTNPLAKKTSEVQVDTGVTAQPTGVGEIITPEVSGSRFGSDMKCSMLKNAENRQACESQINDMIGMMLESEIIDSFDVNRCKELPVGFAADCEMQLADTSVKGPVSDAELAMFREAVRGTLPEQGEEGEIPSFPVYDKTKCAQLKTPGYKEYCEKQVTARIEQEELDQIVQSGDINRCNELKTEDIIINCKEFFGVEVEPEVLGEETIQ